eukprot:6197533-Pleurochrysis_carterae.AAC.2
MALCAERGVGGRCGNLGLSMGTKAGLCKHALESGHNAATTLHERIKCVWADVTARVAVAFARVRLDGKGQSGTCIRQPTTCLLRIGGCASVCCQG